jgi:hypothetical protein
MLYLPNSYPAWLKDLESGRRGSKGAFLMVMELIFLMCLAIVIMAAFNFRDEVEFDHVDHNLMMQEDWLNEWQKDNPNATDEQLAQACVNARILYPADTHNEGDEQELDRTSK